METLVLGALLLAGLVLVALAFAVVKLLFTVILWPLRAVFTLLLLPLLLLQWILAAILGLALLPLIAVAGVVVLIGVSVALLLPLLPIIAIAVIAWLLFKAVRKPATI
jgi:hypothetical protein